MSINSVSCWGSGYCVAAGQYLASTGGEIYPFVVPISNGAPAAGIEVTLPADADTGSGGQQSVPQLDQLSGNRSLRRRR